MNNKQQSKRHTRKAIQRRFEESFDLARLDYKKRVRPGKGKAKVIGILFASAIYFTGFGLAFYSLSNGMIDESFFNKISWIFMVPASVVGSFAFLIANNRKEFPIREDIRAHVIEFEGDNGNLWRYGPILKQLDLKKINVQNLIDASSENRLADMAPEDICDTIHALSHAICEATGPTIAEIENNFSNTNMAA